MKFIWKAKKTKVPERPIDMLRRHDEMIELHREQWDDQLLVNAQWQTYRERADAEFRLMREMINSDRVKLVIFWQVMKYARRGIFWLGAAGFGWAWNHPDKIDKITSFFRTTSDPKS
jgi:hypothetical protein